MPAMSNRPTPLPFLPFLLVAIGACTVHTTTQGPRPGVAPSAPPGARSAANRAAANAANASANQAVASADCPNPQNHCLAEDVVIVSDRAYEKGYIYGFAARPVGAANAAGEASYMNLKSGETVVTEHVFPSHPAAAAELQVGRIALMFHRGDSGMYVPPRTREEAQGGRWWVARIVSVANASQGYVLVAGGYKIATSNLRVLDGAPSPTATVSPQVDEHYLSEDHWIVSDGGGLPERRYIYASVGAPIQTPSPQTQNQGHFIRTREGRIVWTEHAWRTRKATKEDLRPGMHIVLFHGKDGGTYVGPDSRAKALSGRWWITKITDTSTLFRNTVQLAGGYTADLSALRVIIQP